MLCGSCPYTDGLCYTTLPPKVKCTITNNFHYYDDACDCEDYLANKPSQEELDNIKKLLSAPLVVPDNMIQDYSSLSDLTIDEDTSIAGTGLAFHGGISTDGVISAVCTTCIVCDAEIPEGWRKVCPACKKAIKFIKEKFKEELI